MRRSKSVSDQLMCELGASYEAVEQEKENDDRASNASFDRKSGFSLRKSTTFADLKSLHDSDDESFCSDYGSDSGDGCSTGEPRGVKKDSSETLALNAGIETSPEGADEESYLDYITARGLAFCMNQCRDAETRDIVELVQLVRDRGHMRTIALDDLRPMRSSDAIYPEEIDEEIALQAVLDSKFQDNRELRLDFFSRSLRIGVRFIRDVGSDETAEVYGSFEQRMMWNSLMRLQGFRIATIPLTHGMTGKPLAWKELLDTLRNQLMMSPETYVYDPETKSIVNVDAKTAAQHLNVTAGTMRLMRFNERVSNLVRCNRSVEQYVAWDGTSGAPRRATRDSVSSDTSVTSQGIPLARMRRAMSVGRGLGTSPDN